MKYLKIFYFVRHLKTSTKGEDIFKLLNSFFSEHQLEWKNCVSMCMDGSKVMSGHITELVGHIKKVSAECKFTHCVLHQEALAAKHLSEELKEVLDQSVKIVNFIKTRPQKSCYLKILCQDMGSLHENLLLHTVVRWLSRGNVLSCVFELREELHIFLTEHKSHFSSVINGFNWLLKLALI
jgi:hypothetical protein